MMTSAVESSGPMFCVSFRPFVLATGGGGCIATSWWVGEYQACGRDPSAARAAQIQRSLRAAIRRVREEGLPDGGDVPEGSGAGRGGDAGRLSEALAGAAELRRAGGSVHLAVYHCAEHVPVVGQGGVVSEDGGTGRGRRSAEPSATRGAHRPGTAAGGAAGAA